MAKPTCLGDTLMSWGGCGDLKWKFCMMVLRKRKSSILARPSPKQYRFPEKTGWEEVRPTLLATSLLSPSRLHPPGEEGTECQGLRDFQRSPITSLSLSFPCTWHGDESNQDVAIGIYMTLPQKHTNMATVLPS